VVVLNINFSGDEIIGFNSSHVFITENLPEHPVVSELVAGYVAELDVKMGETIGYTEVFLDGERATVRLKESNLGNLVADALAAVTEADIAFQNGGGIRASIQPGPITLKDIYTILPFDNRVVVIEATGEIIWQALENGVSAYPGAAGQFLQVSGLKYTFDAAQPAGSRIVSVTVDDKPIELDKVYRVVANDFLTGGGDYYTMLVDCKIVADTKLWLRDAFTEYLRTVGTVAPELEGRITILNEEN
jgi:2',3'-cyclic-nucleotide 2'-phosphodiesterase (5'-nucleotidase family)